jgi:hypothetical protein
VRDNPSGKHDRLPLDHRTRQWPGHLGLHADPPRHLGLMNFPWPATAPPASAGAPVPESPPYPRRISHGPTIAAN